LHVLGTPPAFILSQDQTLQLKAAIVTPECDGHFNLRVLVVRTRSSVAGPKTFRQRSAGLSRSSFQRASSRSGLYNVGHTKDSVKRLSAVTAGPNAPPQINGSAKIRKRNPAVNPRDEISSIRSRIFLCNASTYHQQRSLARILGGGEKRRGKSSKARKACLGWNSRQDGGRLVERS
jgi:hypothetical protein